MILGELRKVSDGREGRAKATRLVDAYLTLREAVVDAGYASEIDWQDDIQFDAIDETYFLRETAWVILSSGMRESVIANLFDEISRAFLGWSSSTEIVRRRPSCTANALKIFRHPGKINAIGDVAEFVNTIGFDAVKDRVRREGLSELRRLPFVGNVTQFHLAKNLGIDVVKPDRHLVRMAQCAGFPGPHVMCERVAEETGDRVGTVDIVFWRYATLDANYLQTFEAALDSR